MAAQYVNIRKVLDSIMRHPLLQDITLETTIDYTVDFMRIVGVPDMFIEKTEVIEISMYRGMLPSDFHQMIQVRDTEHGKHAFRYSSDSFHMSDDMETTPDLTYKLQGGIIYTSIEEAKIEIAYQAINVDECGYPLLPDNSSFTRALEAYIKKQWFTILFDLGKISPAVLQNTQQEYAWAVGDCQSEFNRLTIDKMESFCNSWRTLIIRDSQHRVGFRTNGTKERLKIQP